MSITQAFRLLVKTNSIMGSVMSWVDILECVEAFTSLVVMIFGASFVLGEPSVLNSKMCRLHCNWVSLLLFWTKLFESTFEHFCTAHHSLEGLSVFFRIEKSSEEWDACWLTQNEVTDQIHQLTLYPHAAFAKLWNGRALKFKEPVYHHWGRWFSPCLVGIEISNY